MNLYRSLISDPNPPFLRYNYPHKVLIRIFLCPTPSIISPSILSRQGLIPRALIGARGLRKLRQLCLQLGKVVECRQTPSVIPAGLGHLGIWVRGSGGRGEPKYWFDKHYTLVLPYLESATPYLNHFFLQSSSPSWANLPTQPSSYSPLPFYLPPHINNVDFTPQLN